MEKFFPAFQFEVRYTNILDFSQIGRKIVSPFVKMASGLNVENANSLEERIRLYFDDEDYELIIMWDRMFFRGQGNLASFAKSNSAIQMPFLSILNALQKLNEFGKVTNILFAANILKKTNTNKNNLLNTFLNPYIDKDFMHELKEYTDAAFTFVKKSDSQEIYINFGPYFGTHELLRRQITPVNINKLDDLNFQGILFEYKHFKIQSKVEMSDFQSMYNNIDKEISSIWKKY